MNLADRAAAGEGSTPILGLLIGVPLSLCIWALLVTIALLTAF